MKATKLQKLIDRYIALEKRVKRINEEIENHLKVESVYGIKKMLGKDKKEHYRIAILEHEDFIKLLKNNNLIDNPFENNPFSPLDGDDPSIKTIKKSGVFIQYIE